jgi:LCP family protein required for cell wall assembly
MEHKVETMNRYSSSHNSTPDWVTIGLWIGFIVSALATAYVSFHTGQDVATAQQAQNPSLAVPTLYPTPNLSDETLPGENEPLQLNSNRPGPRDWNPDEPLVILLMGVDTRKYEGEEGAGLTDTVILAKIDLQENTAGLFSIPRDLWLEHAVSAYSPSKVNQLYMIGEGTGYPGGGPALAMDTLGDFLGTEIHHYATVDFKAFVTLVDAVEGVKINVPKRININPIGPGTVTLKKGVQTLPGDLALAYVRARHTENGDFDRAQRQQQVLVALQRRFVRFDVLPLLIRKFPTLYQEISDGLDTNLTLSQMISLGKASMDISTEDIYQVVLSPPLVEPGFSYQGFYILRPDQPQIQALWEAFLSPSMEADDQTAQAIQRSSLQELVAEEEAVVVVRNGTDTPGLAADTSAFLDQNGITVGEVGNAEQPSPKTYLYDYSGKTYTVQYLLDLMELDESHLYHRYDSDDEMDILIILGDDWAQENPLP